MNYKKSNCDKVLLLPAAGVGARMQANVAKQYLKLGSKTIIEHVIEFFLTIPEISKIVVALAADDQIFQALDCASNSKIITVVGGASRMQSVFNGLQILDENDTVVVHDAVRPFVQKQDLINLFNCQHKSGAILATPVIDTIKVSENNQIIQTLDRSNLWQAQTPQMFSVKLLKQAFTKALQSGRDFTDCASIMEFAGFKPQIIASSRSNIKITTPEDLKFAEYYLDMIYAKNI